MSSRIENRNDNVLLRENVFWNSVHWPVITQKKKKTKNVSPLWSSILQNKLYKFTLILPDSIDTFFFFSFSQQKMKSLSFISLACLTAVHAASVTFKVIAPTAESSVQVNINGQLTQLKAQDEDIPYYTGSAELNDGQSYKVKLKKKEDQSQSTNLLPFFFLVCCWWNCWNIRTYLERYIHQKRILQSTYYLCHQYSWITQHSFRR